MNMATEGAAHTSPTVLDTVQHALVTPSFNADDERLVGESKNEIEIANSFEIVDNTMYEMAGHSLAELKKTRAFVEAKRDEQAAPYLEIKRRAEGVRKAVFDFFDPIIANYKSAEVILTKACAGYIENQRRQREEAEAAARAEQQRLEREAAERQRVAAAEAEALRHKAAEAAASGNNKEAAKLEAKADAKDEKAAEIAASVPMFNMPMPAAPEPAKIAGLSFRARWKGRCTDKMALIKFVAANNQYVNLLDVNESALNKIADSLREAMRVDGCEAFKDTSSARRA